MANLSKRFKFVFNGSNDSGAEATAHQKRYGALELAFIWANSGMVADSDPSKGYTNRLEVANDSSLNDVLFYIQHDISSKRDEALRNPAKKY